MNSQFTPLRAHHSIASLGFVAVALCCAAAGCQSGNAGSGGSTPGSPGSGAAQSATPVDACSMLSPQDISGVLGATVQGKTGSHNPRIGYCSWNNSTTEDSVVLKIGDPGSAPGNTLPTPLPGFPAGTLRPDGMRTNDVGVVEFASGNRRNSVQVAVIRLSNDQRITAALGLVQKISPQVPQ
jgi:hypothetical protein